MPLVPAVCDDCGGVWVPRAMSISNSTNIAIRNFAVSPCPYCAGKGHLPDGLYNATADTLRIVATSDTESLARLRRVLEAAQASHASTEEVASAITAETPEFGALAEILRKLRGVPIITWIMLLLAVVAVVQAEGADRRLDAIESKVDRVLQSVQLPAAAPQPNPLATSANSADVVPKVGRNEPCPCGSGKKYKRCHGR